MDIVADTNIFPAVVLNEPEKARIIRLTSGVTVLAPDILPYEIGTALSAMVKRHKLSEANALKAQESTARIGVRLIAVDVQTSLEIALEHDIYAYDAYFLRCALIFSLPLLTLDRRMARVARELRIRVMEDM